MKQLTYVSSTTEPTDRGVVWQKQTFDPFGIEQRYYSPITGAWELITTPLQLEALTNRLNAFGTINPDFINPNLGVVKGQGNTDANNLEVGDIKPNVIYTNDEGVTVIGKKILTDIYPEQWQGLGESTQL